MKPIDEFLRQHRPQVQDDPAFLLKVQQKMRAVEDIKAEVDRQRKTGRWAIAAALVFGLLLGTLATLAAYCLPQVLADGPGEDFIAQLRSFLQTWRIILPLPVAACAITLGLLATRRVRE